MTIWFYGQAPSRGDPPGRLAFQGSPHGTFLADLAGVDEGTLRQRITFLNLLTAYPGPSSGKGDDFPMEEAVLAADKLMEDWKPGDRVVFAGRKVAVAFGFVQSWFQWQALDDIQPDGTPQIWVATFPHPSRVNVFWNQPFGVRAARYFMHQLMMEEDQL